MRLIQFHYSIKNSTSIKFSVLIHNQQRSKFYKTNYISYISNFIQLFQPSIPFFVSVRYSFFSCRCTIVFQRRRRRHSVKSKIRYRRRRLVIKERYSGSRFKGRRDCGMAKKKGANV